MKPSYFWRALISFFFAAAVQAAPRIALMDFSTDDNSYRSSIAAANFSALLQSKLTDMNSLEWVERSQLQAAEDELSLTAGGYVSPSTALHLGKFVKADLLVEGQFVFTATQNRELRIEVIDLDHAEVLVEGETPIHGATNRPVEVSAADVETTSKTFEDVFQRALERRAQIKTQTVIAPLFFANTSNSRRLDYFETELQSALNSSMSNHNLCVLQFPRAATAVNEAELVLAGLVEQDPNAWQKVADVYLPGNSPNHHPPTTNFQQKILYQPGAILGGGAVQDVTAEFPPFPPMVFPHGRGGNYPWQLTKELPSNKEAFMPGDAPNWGHIFSQ